MGQSILEKINLPLNEENKKKIIEAIITEVKSAGSSRVGYHADKVLKPALSPTPYNVKSKIEASITSSGKYMSRPHPNFKNDFEILKNPNYKPKWQDWLVAAGIAILSAVATVIVDKSLEKPNSLKGNQEYEQLKSRVDQIENQSKNRTSPQSSTKTDKK